MEDNQLNEAAAAQAADGGSRRQLQAWVADDANGTPRRLGRDDSGLGPLAVVVSASACITALTAPVKTPAVVGAVLAGMVTLFVALWVSTQLGRGRRGMGLVSLYLSFVALVVAIAAGGEFDPDILVKLYNAFAD